MAAQQMTHTTAGNFRPADAAMATAILLLGAFLAGSGTLFAGHLRSSASRRQSLTFEDQLGLAATTIGLIVVTWWILSFLIAVASAVLDRSGHRVASAAAGKFSPAFMRRLALAAVGLQLATAPLANAAPGTFGPEDPGPGGPLPPAVAAAWVPGGSAVHPEPALPSPAALPVPGPAASPPAASPPAASPPAASSTGLDPRWMPSPAPADPGSLAPAQLRTPEPGTGLREVTVRAGDSLWSICAAELGPLASDVDVALAWPRLYQHNRYVVGPDPALLRPGQVLQVPSGL